ncbi:MAG: hypothetical protein JRI30_03750 [Deltaproteobacteria bacterium]|nr:hypothetical protein [Deltaproteobacteria bacterium]
MVKYSSFRKKSLFKTRWFDICCFLFVVLIVSVTALYFTNKDFAIELRQVRQPKPNLFNIGIDVSQTIKPGVLADFKKALILRLRNFTGDKKVRYHISLFGTPGCEKEAIVDVVSTQSPKDTDSFNRRVEKDITQISIARKVKGQDDTKPLTTPLFCFLEKVLTERVGERVIILSDLVNDDEGCQKHYSLPVKIIQNFGIHKDGQIIFLYPEPYLSNKYTIPEIYKKLINKQENFIKEMRKLSSQGKVRVFFYRIPDNPQKRLPFLRSKLQNSIPATTFEVIWERVSKMINTIICAVRG